MLEEYRKNGQCVREMFRLEFDKLSAESVLVVLSRSWRISGCID